MRRKGGAAPSLNEVDLSLRLEPAAYDKKLAQVQLTLTTIQQAYLLSGQSAVIVFEGWDAAGKGGAIRRTSAAFDPRSFKVWPIGPPRNYYLARLYLLLSWSGFHRRAPSPPSTGPGTAGSWWSGSRS